MSLPAPVLIAVAVTAPANTVSFAEPVLIVVTLPLITSDIVTAPVMAEASYVTTLAVRAACVRAPDPVKVTSPYAPAAPAVIAVVKVTPLAPPAIVRSAPLADADSEVRLDFVPSVDVSTLASTVTVLA